jgi:hypothetical protein
MSETEILIIEELRKIEKELGVIITNIHITPLDPISSQ